MAAGLAARMPARAAPPNLAQPATAACLASTAAAAVPHRALTVPHAECDVECRCVVTAPHFGCLLGACVAAHACAGCTRPSAAAERASVASTRRAGATTHLPDGGATRAQQPHPTAAAPQTQWTAGPARELRAAAAPFGPPSATCAVHTVATCTPSVAASRRCPPTRLGTTATAAGPNGAPRVSASAMRHVRHLVRSAGCPRRGAAVSGLLGLRLLRVDVRLWLRAGRCMALVLAPSCLTLPNCLGHLRPGEGGRVGRRRAASAAGASRSSPLHTSSRGRARLRDLRCFLSAFACERARCCWLGLGGALAFLGRQGTGSSRFSIGHMVAWTSGLAAGLGGRSRRNQREGEGERAESCLVSASGARS